MRQHVARLLRTAGLDVRRKPRPLIRSPHELHLTLGFVVAHLAAHNPDRRMLVLQVGAYDGEANDPIREVLLAYGWPAILVEPQPEPFRRLQRLYAGRDNVQTVNAAVGEADGARTLYTVADPQHEFAGQVASFDPQHATRALGRGVAVASLEVPTLTFDTLLAGRHVDILQIDAEGFDAALIRLFDVPARLPQVISYEHQHMTQRQQDEVAGLLIGTGYSLGVDFGGADTVAYRV